MTQRPLHILPLIVFSQFAGTSLWFAGNAVLPDIQRHFQLTGDALGNITSIVQLGFIGGTFVFALLSIADRFHPTRVFVLSSLLASISNLMIVWVAKDYYAVLVFRFFTGFFLAGIYPVGMKIAADWYEQGLGKALGFLVGALVLGTAFPHLLRDQAWQLPWRQVIYATSAIATAGGVLMWALVPGGPFRRRGAGFHPKAMWKVFGAAGFRSAAGGYFGHMWELYTFWAFVPVLLELHQKQSGANYSIPLWSFVIIGIGGISCVAGGYLSRVAGSARVAFFSLLLSALCCCLYWLPMQAGAAVFPAFMVLWGIAVIADSPQFSALVAQTAPPEHKGTALTVVTCIGFAITIASIQLISLLFHRYGSGLAFLALIPGPLFGLRMLYRLLKKS